MNRGRRREHLTTVYKELPWRFVLVNAVLRMNCGTLYFCRLYACIPTSLAISYQATQTAEAGSRRFISGWQRGATNTNVVIAYLFRQRTKLGSYLYFFFFHLVHEWKVIYLLILVMMQNGPDVYMRLYVSCFVNMRLFFCNKSGLNINYSGLILPLWTKQRFCFSATVFQNQVLVSVSVVGNKKRARKKTEL